MSDPPPPARAATRTGAWAYPTAAGLIAGAVAVAALALFRPQAPPPRVWPEGMRAAVDPDAPATRPLDRPRWLASSAPVRLPAPPFAAGAGPVLRAALDRPVDHFAADHLPADAAVRRWAELAGANVAVNWPALQTVGLDRAQPVTLDLRGVPAGQVLRLLIDRVGVGAAPRVVLYADGDVLRVEPDDGDGPRHRARLVTRLYDVRPLVLDAVRWHALIFDDSRPDDLEELAADRLTFRLEEAVAPETWQDNSAGTCTANYWSGWLIVRHTPEVQAQVDAYLAALGRDRETRPSTLP